MDFLIELNLRLKTMSTKSAAASALVGLLALTICLLAWRGGFEALSQISGDGLADKYSIEKTCMSDLYWPGWPIQINTMGHSMGNFAPNIALYAINKAACNSSKLLPLNSSQSFLAIGILLTLALGYAACRLASISKFASIFSAISMATAPCSFSRLGHLSLSQLWPVLPSIACSIAIISLYKYRSPAPKWGLAKYLGIGAAFGALAFSAQDYYAIFGSALVASSMGWRVLGPQNLWEGDNNTKRTEKNHTRYSAIAIGLGFIGINFLMLASKLAIWQIPTWAQESTARSPSEQFLYGFWPMALFDSPIVSQSLREALQQSGIAITETPFMSQGSFLIFIATIISICSLSRRNLSEMEAKPLIVNKAACTVFLISILISLLCATPGSAGTLFAVFISPQLRALNRFMPYIYGPAILVIGLWLEEKIKQAIQIIK
jgi:hypothetical protein